jgi:ADP-ribosyl-[dinitrogen reductase] hydrolase
VVDTRERLEGGIWGLLVGDAVGVPYEFHPPHEIPQLDRIELDPPVGFRRAHLGVPPGTWSDDGAQALCLLASLLDRGRLDIDDLGRRLLAWYEDGYLAVDGKVFDVGVQTSHALLELRAGARAIDAAPKDERANGNGSLMRVLPLALWHRGSDAELVEDAHLQSLVTHGHPRSQVCCALYCLWARRIVQGADAPWEEAVHALENMHEARSITHLGELSYHVRPLDGIEGRGGGYVVDCLRSVRQAFEAGGYEAVVKAAIALGNDTDTTACVAGGIAGLRDGVTAIPARWLDRLRGRELAEPLVAALLGR